MTDFNCTDSQENNSDLISEDRLEEILNNRFDVEALAQMVEHLDHANKLSNKLTSAFNHIRSETGRLGQVVGPMQQEIRELILEVAMLKRALVSIGQTGVMERRKIERELVRELFPPTQPRPGAGMMVNTATPKSPQTVDCENRLHLCKAACCRIFEVHLTPQEVIDENHEWNPRRPYAMTKNRVGCTYLQSGGCACTIYQSRPKTCSNYSCANDRRIWQDFENKVIDPDLAKRLATLDVNTQTLPAAPRESMSNGTPVSPTSVPPSTTQPRTAPVTSTSASLSTIEPAHEPEKTKVGPPNFDELRKLTVPKPAKLFVPLSKSDGNGKSANPSDAQNG